MNVGVAGSGPIALCIARALQRRGARVTLHVAPVEAGVGHGAWWWAGGMLAPWSEQEECGASLPFIRRWAAPSLQAWRALLDGELRGEALAERSVHVYASSEEAAAARSIARLRAMGAPVALRPTASAAPSVSNLAWGSAVELEGERCVDPRSACPRLRAAVVEAGGGVREGLVSPGEVAADYDVFVDARGLGARDTQRTLRGVRGEMFLLRETNTSSAVSSAAGVGLPERVMLRLFHGRGHACLVPRGGGVWYLGATAVESEVQSVYLRSALDLLACAAGFFPALMEAEIVEMGAGLRPAFADNTPRVSWEPALRVFSVNGLYRHGVFLAPAVAERLAHLLEGPERGWGEVGDWFSPSCAS